MTSTSRSPDKSSSFTDWLNYLGNIHVSAIDMGLERVLPVAKKLGITKPSAKVVTVAGTNGKGSTTKTVAALCQAAGKKVALYQSPHVFSFNERVSINGDYACDQALIEAFIAVDAARKACALSLSFFEATTLAAFLIFTQEACDVWVLEVGLGGRLDVVNIIDADVAVITNIGLDHTDWLGHDIETIGFEKAGILRANIPCVLASHMPERVYKQAEKLNCQLIEADKGYAWQLAKSVGKLTEWIYTSPAVTMKLPIPKLALQNVAAGLSAFFALQLPIEFDILAQTVKDLSLIGRFDERVYQGKRLIMDAAHNPDGALFFIDQLKQRYLDIDKKPIHIVFSMLADKDMKGVFEVVHDQLPKAHWHIAPLTVTRAAPLELLKTTINQSTIPKENQAIYNRINDALAHAIDESEDDANILILGSFHTLAETIGFGKLGKSDIVK